MPTLSKRCAQRGCEIELVLVLGTDLPIYCWRHTSGTSADTGSGDREPTGVVVTAEKPVPRTPDKERNPR